MQKAKLRPETDPMTTTWSASDVAMDIMLHVASLLAPHIAKERARDETHRNTCIKNYVQAAFTRLCLEDRRHMQEGTQKRRCGRAQQTYKHIP
jgi:hypothetical protein